MMISKSIYSKSSLCLNVGSQRVFIPRPPHSLIISDQGITTVSQFLQHVRSNTPGINEHDTGLRWPTDLPSLVTAEG